MEYITVIAQLISKIQLLEKRVKKMEKRLIEEGVFDETDATEDENLDMENLILNQNRKKDLKITTDAIRTHINKLIYKAYVNGQSTITIIARDIHNELNLQSRYPMVCNAMRQCMKIGDEVIYSPASGYSSTLEIMYKTRNN